jgi:hypothetical protein
VEASAAGAAEGARRIENAERHVRARRGDIPP